MKFRTRYTAGCIVGFLVFLMFMSGIYDRLQIQLDHMYIDPEHRQSLFKSGNISLNSSSQYQSPLVTISAKEFQENPYMRTGNPLIDKYGSNDPYNDGENGRGVYLSPEYDNKISTAIRKHQINVLVSDKIPVNRKVPDSRPAGCRKRTYPHDLPKTSIIIPFYDEWPSVLVRTVYSIINRTPRHLLQEIILVDDNSQIAELKTPLDNYIDMNFPKGLVKLIHNPTREGLIKARLRGWKASVGEVIVFFDSHMEVNIDWLQPLLTAVKNNRTTIAMGMLDYINMNTFEYKFTPGYYTRYGFDWRLVFFETFFRPDQVGPAMEDPRPGTVMVGPAFAVDSKYFGEIGAYDDGMKIWGGENLEFPWRVWMCGGRLLHFPCSRIGHIARFQPYSFPGGRRKTEIYNYKRAIEVWMEPNHKKFIYDYFPSMENMPVGDLTERFKIKEKLQCRNFTWYLENIWPELAVFDDNAIAWGSVRNIIKNECLDNDEYLFQMPAPLYVKPCTHKLATQGFSLTKDHLLKSSLQCVVVKQMKNGARPKLEDCIVGPRDKWEHKRNSTLKHMKSGLCLELDHTGLVMHRCAPGIPRQQWKFANYNI